VEAGHDPRRFTGDLLERLRDLVLLKAVPDAADKGLIAVPEDELSRMRDQADKLGPATLTRYAEILHAGLIEMRGATAPRLLVELLCARMLLPAAAATDAAVLQRLEGIERRMTLAPAPSVPAAPSAAALPAAAPAPVPTPAPAPVAQPVARSAPAADGAVAAMDSTGVRQIWPELLRKVGERSKPTLVLLQNATVRTVEGNTLVLAMPTAGLARQLAQESRAEVIRTTLRDLVAGDWQVQCVHGEAPAPADSPGAARRPAAPTRPRPAEPPAARAPEPPPVAQPVVPPPAVEPTPPRAVDEDVPVPPEPQYDEPPPDMADEDIPVQPPASTRRDPEAVAVTMLTEQLHARRIT
jgi:DNA polymerase-3 subunit gamma/tau